MNLLLEFVDTRIFVFKQSGKIRYMYGHGVYFIRQRLGEEDLFEFLQHLLVIKRSRNMIAVIDLD